MMRFSLILMVLFLTACGPTNEQKYSDASTAYMAETERLEGLEQELAEIQGQIDKLPANLVTQETVDRMKELRLYLTFQEEKVAEQRKLMDQYAP